MSMPMSPNPTRVLRSVLADPGRWWPETLRARRAQPGRDTPWEGFAPTSWPRQG